MFRRIFLLVICAAVLVGGLLFFYNRGDSSTGTDNTDKTTEIQDTLTNDLKTNEEAEPASPPEPTEEKNTTNSEEKPTTKTEEDAQVSAVLTRAEDRGAAIFASSFIESEVGGTCTLTLSHPEQQIKQSMKATFEVNKYTCNFKVNENKFTYDGEWSASVVFVSNKAQTTSNSLKFLVTL